MRVYIHVQDLYMTVVAKKKKRKENVLFSFIEQFEWCDDSLAQNLPEGKVNELSGARDEIILFQWHHWKIYIAHFKNDWFVYVIRLEAVTRGFKAWWVDVMEILLMMCLGKSYFLKKQRLYRLLWLLARLVAAGAPFMTNIYVKINLHGALPTGVLFQIKAKDRGGTLTNAVKCSAHLGDGFLLSCCIEIYSGVCFWRAQKHIGNILRDISG